MCCRSSIDTSQSSEVGGGEHRPRRSLRLGSVPGMQGKWSKHGSFLPAWLRSSAAAVKRRLESNNYSLGTLDASPRGLVKCLIGATQLSNPPWWGISFWPLFWAREYEADAASSVGCRMACHPLQHTFDLRCAVFTNEAFRRPRGGSAGHRI
jgi:hypothetical protein